MAKNELDCVMQDAHSVLCMVVYTLQDVLMNCDSIPGIGEGLTFAVDQEEMNVAYGALEALRSVRDRLSEALASV